jgi:anti-sigma28 factor (negative regulator of flagellin synthesis)
MQGVSFSSTSAAGRIAAAPAVRTQPGQVNGQPVAPIAAVQRGSDQVEVSQLATYLSTLRSLPSVRQDLIDSVKAQIAAGTYDTPERFDAALNGLVNDAATDTLIPAQDADGDNDGR